MTYTIEQIERAFRQAPLLLVDATVQPPTEQLLSIPFDEAWRRFREELERMTQENHNQTRFCNVCMQPIAYIGDSSVSTCGHTVKFKNRAV